MAWGRGDTRAHTPPLEFGSRWHNRRCVTKKVCHKKAARREQAKAADAGTVTKQGTWPGIVGRPPKAARAAKMARMGAKERVRMQIEP